MPERVCLYGPNDQQPNWGIETITVDTIFYIFLVRTINNPTEGLKRKIYQCIDDIKIRPNDQQPNWGIETAVQGEYVLAERRSERSTTQLRDWNLWI